jgi:branched-subunit amino acid transport protein
VSEPWHAGPWALIALAAAATYVWRWLGVLLAGRIDPASARFEWAGCVAYALLAGLIARMILLPFGPLAETPMADRIGAAVIALALFFLSRRNLLVGVAAGAGALVLFTWGRLTLAG